VGRVSEYISKKLAEKGALHFSLIDPDEISPDDLPKIVQTIETVGSDAIMVGGSTVADQVLLRDIVKTIKSHVTLPVILFPNNLTGITSNADAIWFMSLLNSLNPYFITGAQMIAAPYIKKIGLEPLPLAYLIVGEGKTAGYIGYANPLPYDKPELIAAYALAAQYMGFKYVYLEAGSGAGKSVDPNVVRLVKSVADNIILVVGGGIRDGNTAYQLVVAGADIIVTGNVIQENIDRIKDIIEGVKKGGNKRI
jgi:phosphoglycerol geranylgeranyltransferase